MSDLLVSDFVDVRKRARELAVPVLDNLALLPERFADGAESALTVNQESSTLRKLLAEANIPVQVLGESSGARIMIQKSADWVAPILFVGAGLWSQNPLAVEVAISVIGSYAADMLKRARPTGTVKLSIAVESKTKKRTKILTYEGPVEGIGTIAKAVERIANE